MELLLSAIANKKFNYQILIRVLLWVVSTFFFFLNLPMGRHFFLHGSEWGYDGFPTRLIYRYGWQARIMFAKGSVAVGG